MKKLLFIALCTAAVGSVSAQKANVDAAKKLGGKIDKIEEARALIKEAIANPETKDQANTYVIASDIELKAYDKAKKDLGLKSENADPEKLVQMNQYLLNAYPYILQSVEVGENDPKSKALGEAQKKLASHVADFFQAGADLYGAKKYYPEAYKAFEYYADIPELPFMQGSVNIPDSIRATAYFNAGLSGWAASELPAAAAAFKKAINAHYDKPEAYIYGLACWQNMMQNDSTVYDQAQAEIFDISKLGYAKFGMSQPVFLNNMVNVLVEQNQEQQAIYMIGSLIAENETAALYGLRGYVYDRMGMDTESVADYRKAASMEDADFETLKNAGKKIFRRGTELWNEIEGNSAEANAKRKEVRENYWGRAFEIASKAKMIKPADVSASDLDYLIDQINYALESLR